MRQPSRTSLSIGSAATSPWISRSTQSNGIACTPAAKQYHRENGSMADAWHDIFPKAVRLEAAESIARSWVEEFKLGNFWD